MSGAGFIPDVMPSESKPRTRIRVGHKQTASRGWEYETTVEVEWDGMYGGRDDPEALARLQDLLAEVRGLGEAERDARNARDGAR